VKRLLVGIALTFAGLCQAAPAPIPKPIPKVEEKHLIGYEFQWRYGMGEGTFTLQAGGKFTSTWGGTNYYGSWSYKDGVLYTKETTDGKFFCQFDYKITVQIDYRGRVLNKPIVGRCTNGTDVKFHSPRKVP